MSNAKYHKVRIMRNGDFVGLYRPVSQALGARGWQLWRTVIDEQYGKKTYIEEEKGRPYCNENHAIPSCIKLTRENLSALDGALGAGECRTPERIRAIASAIDPTWDNHLW